MASSLPQNLGFQEDIKVTPISSHRYAADLSSDWAIGAVPHGGYSTALLCNLATVHFQLVHPDKHNGCARPIAIQISFIRSTMIGPATIAVEDVKLGARTSVVHLSLSQKSPQEGKETARIVAYVTMSDRISDAGVSIPTELSLYTPLSSLKPPSMSAKDNWHRVILPAPQFARAAGQAEVWQLADEGLPHRKFVYHQWARFRPSGQVGRWTAQSLPFLLDLFPHALSRLGEMGGEVLLQESKVQKRFSEKVDPTPFSYPTMSLQGDFRKELPLEGVEWLYSHVTFRSVDNGRTSIDIIILDDQGDVIAYTSHTALIMSPRSNGRVTKKESL